MRVSFYFCLKDQALQSYVDFDECSNGTSHSCLESNHQLIVNQDSKNKWWKKYVKVSQYLRYNFWCVYVCWPYTQDDVTWLLGYFLFVGTCMWIITLSEIDPSHMYRVSTN